jgi:hypothetical protein
MRQAEDALEAARAVSTSEVEALSLATEPTTVPGTWLGSGLPGSERCPFPGLRGARFEEHRQGRERPRERDGAKRKRADDRHLERKHRTLRGGPVSGR